MIGTNKVLTKELMKLMDEYVSMGKNSCATLARESGVPYSTVVRLLKGGNVPSFESVFPILLTIQNYKSALAFVKKHYPLIGTYLLAKSNGGVPTSFKSVVGPAASKFVAKKATKTARKGKK